MLSLAISPKYATDGALFAGTEAHGLFHSGDGGGTWQRRGMGETDDTVNGVLLSPEFPTQAHVLTLLADDLVVSRDGGYSWAKWRVNMSLEHGLASVVAPHGLDPDAPLLVGLANGEILRL